MKVIAVFDDKNYGDNWFKYSRDAVRAIILFNEKIALVKSEKEGFYKFPGGGVEEGETHEEALIRETKEETGLIVIPNSIKEFGMIQEIRKSIYDIEEIFDQKSYYYFADVYKEVTNQNLDNYEVELGYVLEWSDIKEAYNINIELSKNYKSKFIMREAEVLRLVLDYLKERK